MHRFHIPPEQVSDEEAYLTGDQQKQIRNVLRLAPGDVIALFDGSGREYVTRIENMEKHRVLGRVIETRMPNTEPSRRLTVVLSLLKGGSMDFALQKCTEVGTSEFVVVTTSRTVPHVPEERVPGRLERWRSIVKEAAEQSGRTRVPGVTGIDSFDEALNRVRNEGKRVIAWESEERSSLLSTLRPIPASESVTYFVGPEGGFSTEEVAAAAKAGVAPVSLGARILRAETAALVGSALIIYCGSA